MTPYSKVYDKFTSKIEDLDLARMSNKDREMILWNYLDSALALIEAEQISMQHDLTQRDDEIRTFTIDLRPNEIEAIALYMVGMWYEEKLNSLQHTAMFWGTTDEKWNNPKDHIKVISDEQEKYFLRARKMFRDYNYKVGLLQENHS